MLFRLEPIQHFGKQPPFLIIGTVQNGAQILKIRRNTINFCLIKGLIHLLNRIGTIHSMNNQFGQHRIIKRSHDNIPANPSLNPRRRRKTAVVHASGSRTELISGILCIDANFDGMAFRGADQRTNITQLSGGFPDHPLHQIYPHDLFRDTMLHLQARIHFQKIKAFLCLIIQELYRTGIAIPGRMSQTFGCFIHRLADSLRQIRRRRLLHHFLVAPLHRTVPLSDRYSFSISIAENLNLNMTGALHIFFEKYAIIFKVAFCQITDLIIRVLQIGFIPANAYADTAAARRAFKHNRISDLCGSPYRFLPAAQKIRPRKQRHSDLPCQRAGGMFQTEQTDLFRRRSDKDNPILLTGSGKICIFTEESITRMNSLCSRFLRRTNDLIDIQIRLPNRPIAETNRFISTDDMQTVLICLCINSHTGNPHLFQSPLNTNCNRSAVRNQHLGKHKPFLLSFRINPRSRAVSALDYKHCRDY